MPDDETRERRREYDKQRRATDAHRRYRAEYMRRWRANNPQAARAIDKRHRDNRDPEKWRAYYAEWEARHPESQAERDRRDREKNVLNLAGGRIRINSLPPELRPVARAIKEARQALKESRNG